jgi:hypothetical protein
VHAPPPEHATPVSSLTSAPAGLGVTTTDHPEPAAAATAPEAGTVAPTEAATKAANKARLMTSPLLAVAVPGTAGTARTVNTRAIASSFKQPRVSSRSAPARRRLRSFVPGGDRARLQASRSGCSVAEDLTQPESGQRKIRLDDNQNREPHKNRQQRS